MSIPLIEIPDTILSLVLFIKPNIVENTIKPINRITEIIVITIVYF